MKTTPSSATEINVVPLTNTNSAILTYLEKDKMFMNPVYQREANIWSDEKKQLLIDSIINHFDIPKLYVHEYLEPKLIGGKKKKYQSLMESSGFWPFGISSTMSILWPTGLNTFLIRQQNFLV